MSSFLRSVKTGGSSTFSVCLAGVPGPSLGSHEPSSGAGAPMSSTTSDGLRADPGEPGTPAQIARRRSQRGIALALGGEGKLDEAKAMYERALAGRERTLGADHPHTLGTVNNLAGLLNQVGDAAAAAALRERFGCE